MDVRELQLIAAADAVRAWVHAQRATWDNPYLYTTMPVAQPAAARAVAGDMTPAMAADAPADVLVSQSPMGPRLGLRDAIDRINEMLRPALSVAWPSWSVVGAAVLVVVMAGTARLFWPTWPRTINDEMTVGRQVVETGRNVVAQGRRVVDVGREVVEKGRRVVGSTPGGAPAESGAGAVATGALQIESDPVGARIFIDGRERGVTPLTIADLAPGTYNVLLRAGAGSVQHKVVINAGQTAKVVEGIFSGWLRVISPIDVLVSEGSRGLRLDDSDQVLLAPGTHDVLIENRSLGYRELHHVTVRPGETTTISVELSPSTLTVTSTEPAEVTIDGEPAGATPLTDYPVSKGIRQVTVTGASGTVQRLTVNVTREPARVDVDLTMPQAIPR